MAATRRERKVVTVVFCDLVGFTQRAEQLDPEDVEAVLTPYHERLRAELERYGGTVEKFIGDAVMALFGAPTAHEDDAERAVRACLAIRDWAVDEDDVQVRIAVTTGEALIRLDARPEAGEGMASGDVVNTAARLQNAAPVNGILGDETTYRATRQVVDYRAASAVEAKGKSEPIPVWEALSAHARFGVDVAHEARTELVGRERELNAVRDAFERARHERAPQLLTLVGVPGMGKSRLVYELSRIVDADHELITWRQGRCLAYGDGVTLWALGEIVKAQAGILEQDTLDDVTAKISAAVADALSGTGDEAWVESHLLALVGLASETELGGDRRNEAFSAWRRFLEALAEQRPLVLVFEDLHWADESLLDFVDELVDWMSDAPLLVVGTARPELLERRPGWGGGKLNATTLALSPLTDDQTALLLARLLGSPVLAADSQQTLLERAGGNPLYAEQFADLYVEQGSAHELPLPETLQGIIAARLDALAQSEKSLLQDSAVVGKVFWASALQDGDVATALHSLERKGFVRRQKRSSLEGESEFAFAHALVRDVAYGQIARADRAEKHRHVAEWIESLGRPEDHAEMSAHHWRSALELGRASGGDTGELAEKTRLALRHAGDRAFALNNHAAAAALFDQALVLWPEEDEERPRLLFRWARTLHLAYDARREKALETARDALLAADDTETAAEVESFLSQHFWYRGQGELARSHLARAEELAGDTVSASAARVLAVSARTRTIATEHESGLRIATSALSMAEELGVDELRAHALTTIGLAKRGVGDASGDEDMERALEIALEVDSPIASTIVNNFAVQAFLEGRLGRAYELYSEALRLAHRFGDGASMRFIRANRMFIDVVRGDWDPALVDADAFIAECEAGSPHTQESIVRIVRGIMREARGDSDGALADHRRAVELARESGDLSQLVGSLARCASTHAERGELDEAYALIEELRPAFRKHGPHGAIHEIAHLADEMGVTREFREVLDAPPFRDFPWIRAALLTLDGDLREAANVYAAMENRAFEARMLLRIGERAVVRGDQAETEVRQALAFYRSVGATHYVRRAQALLQTSAYSDSA